MRLLPLLTVALAAVLLCGGSARLAAEPLLFEFQTVADVSEFGLSVTEPIAIRFIYDPLTVPQTKSIGDPVVVRTGWGPVHGTLEVDGDIVTIVGGIDVRNQDGFVDGFLIPCADGDVTAFIGKGFGNAASDAPRSAGYKCVQSFQS